MTITDYLNADHKKEDRNKYFEVTDYCGKKMILEFNETFIWVTTAKTIDEHKELMDKKTEDGALDRQVLHFNKYEFKQLISILKLIENSMTLDI